MDNTPIKDPKTASLEEIKKIVEQGSYINSSDDYDALVYASNHRILEIIKFLAENGYDLTAKNNFLQKWATEKGHLEVIEYLKEYELKN